jgi:hypothetical protein
MKQQPLTNLEINTLARNIACVLVFENYGNIAISQPAAVNEELISHYIAEGLKKYIVLPKYEINQTL